MTAPAGRYWRTVGSVLGGTALAQAIQLIASLLIARLYAPAEFGLFAAWLGGVQLAAVTLTGRFEVALALEPDGMPRRVAVCATLATVALAGVALCAVVGAIVLWGGFVQVPATLWWLLVPTAMAIAAAQTWQSWAAAEGRVANLSRLRIAQAAAVSGMQVLAGLWLASAVALAWAQLLGLAIGLAIACQLLPLARPGLPHGAALRAGIVRSGRASGAFHCSRCRPTASTARRRNSRC